MHATWDLVVAHLARRFPALGHDSASAVRFVVVVDGHRVGLRARATTAYGVPMVALTAELGVADALDPVLALVLNGQLVTGALAIDMHVLALRLLVADVAELAERFDLFVREAATLKSHLVLPIIPAQTADVFAHLSD